MPLEKYVVSSTFRHPVFGVVKVRVMPTSNHVKMQWEGQTLLVNIPPRITVERFYGFLDKAKDKILTTRPVLYFNIGQRIECQEVDFVITRNEGPLAKDGVMTRINRHGLPEGKQCEVILALSDNLAAEIETENVQTFINRLLLKRAAAAVHDFVVPHAEELAASLGLKPRGWRVKHCKGSLGSCDAKGVITLGARLIFMPPHLRDYIIYHELAHLSEMNHSPEFHRICNAYCSGREKQLIAEYKAFKYPVF